MALLTDEHKAYIGTEEHTITVEVSRRDIQKYSVATEQRQEKYLKGDEAPPMFIFNLLSEIGTLENYRVDGLAKSRSRGPRLPLKRVMAGGTELYLHRPIRPGDRIEGTRKIIDMYEKEGSAGPLIFTVSKLTVVTVSGDPILDEIQTGIAR